MTLILTISSVSGSTVHGVEHSLHSVTALLTFPFLSELAVEALRFVVLDGGPRLAMVDGRKRKN